MATLSHIKRRLPSPRGRLKAGRVGTLLRAGLILLLVGMIAFAVYQIARHATAGLSTLRTQEIVDRSYVRLELCLFRDEVPVTVEGSNICLYTVRDGERVSVGATLGTAYTAAGIDARALQQSLNACSDRLALLRETGGTGTPADARREAEAVDRHYLGLLEATGRGDLAAVAGFAGEMQAGIGRYDILTGNTLGAGTADALLAEQAALVAGCTPVADVTTSQSGYFYYANDGYETVFPYAAALTMTPAEFRTMAATAATPTPSGTVGKLVLTPTWYAATYVSLSDPAVELFQQGIQSGASYAMTCLGDADSTVTMTIERMEPDGDGVLLVFSSKEMPAGFAFDRTLRVETAASSVSGYRVPSEALVTLRSETTGEDVTGVYILSGGVVEFRRVRIRVRRDGYIIADTYEDVEALLETMTDEQRAAATSDGWSYLRLNDNMITAGNGLYEGKMIG